MTIKADIQETNRLMQSFIMRLARLEAAAGGNQAKQLFDRATIPLALAFVVDEGKDAADAACWGAYANAILEQRASVDYVSVRERAIQDRLRAALDHITMAEEGHKLVAIKFAHDVAPPLARDESPTASFVAHDGTIVAITAVQESLKIDLADGRTHDASPWHRFKTKRGWVAACNLTVYDVILTERA